MNNSNPIGKKDINTIRSEIENLYNTKKEVYIDINNKRRRMKNVKVIITGVYNCFFTVESNVNGYNESFTISYVDIMIGQYEIKE